MRREVAVALSAGLAALVAGADAGALAQTVARRPGTMIVKAQLVGTEWRFIQVGGARVPAGVATMLRLRDGRASGRAGCNSFGASWQLTDEGGIRFSKLMSTQMACLEPAGTMQVERGVMAALRQVVRVERHGSELVLLDAAGNPLATLREEVSPRPHGAGQAGH